MAFAILGTQEYYRVIMIQTRYLMLMSCTPQVDMCSHLEVVLFYESFVSKPSMGSTMEAELIALDIASVEAEWLCGG